MLNLGGMANINPFAYMKNMVGNLVQNNQEEEEEDDDDDGQQFNMKVDDV